MITYFGNHVCRLLSVGMFLTVAISGQIGGNYDLSHNVISGGGGSNSVGGTYIVDGTVGQPQAGALSTQGSFNLRGGFWTFQPPAPTAAAVTVSGRVVTPDGRGLRNAVVTLTDPTGMTRTVTTSSFGLYSFDDVQVGRTYVMKVNSKLYRFSSIALPVADTLTNVDFVGQE